MDYFQQWSAIARRRDWRDYILTRRTDEQFEAEGRDQARLIQRRIGGAETVAEFGCGVGRVLQFVKAARRYGIDASEEFLSRITDPGITPILSDGFDIDLPGASVDFIYSLMVFQHIQKDDHPAIIAELARILKPFGRMFIQFPRAGCDYYKPSSFVNVYRRDEVQNLFPAFDVEIEQGALAAYVDGQAGNREYFATVAKR